jgi:hypothetical protein
MKTTKVMLVGLCTFMLTWVLITLLISYLFSSDFRETMANAFIIMVIIGWIPSVIVGMDYSEKLNLNK